MGVHQLTAGFFGWISSRVWHGSFCGRSAWCRGRFRSPCDADRFRGFVGHRL